eukprot:scaffold197949_cov18-Tisochrysis_lutea.AAC.2
MQVHVAPVPVMLAPKQQVQVVVQVMAMLPFQGAPDLLLDYKMGNTVVHQVRGSVAVAENVHVGRVGCLRTEAMFAQSMGAVGDMCTAHVMLHVLLQLTLITGIFNPWVLRMTKVVMNRSCASGALSALYTRLSCPCDRQASDDKNVSWRLPGRHVILLYYLVSVVLMTGKRLMIKVCHGPAVACVATQVCHSGAGHLQRAVLLPVEGKQ